MRQRQLHGGRWLFAVAGDGWYGARLGPCYVTLRSPAVRALFSERYRHGCKVLPLGRGWRIVASWQRPSPKRVIFV